MSLMEREAALSQAAREAVAASHAHYPDAALPSLIGSERQITWARTLRRQALATMAAAEALAPYFSSAVGDRETQALVSAIREAISAARDEALRYTDARYWIDAPRSTYGPLRARIEPWDRRVERSLTTRQFSARIPWPALRAEALRLVRASPVYSDATQQRPDAGDHARTGAACSPGQVGARPL